MSAEPGEVLGPGAVFGFSAMLTERSIGPRAVAAGTATVARIPAALAGPAFASPSGARFLPRPWRPIAGGAGIPTYSTIDELIEREPLVVDGRHPRRRGGPADDRAGRAGRRGPDRRRGGSELVTDSLLRARVLVGGRPASTPATPGHGHHGADGPVG